MGGVPRVPSLRGPRRGLRGRPFPGFLIENSAPEHDPSVSWTRLLGMWPPGSWQTLSEESLPVLPPASCNRRCCCRCYRRTCRRALAPVLQPVLLPGWCCAGAAAGAAAVVAAGLPPVPPVCCRCCGWSAAGATAGAVAGVTTGAAASAAAGAVAGAAVPRCRRCCGRRCCNSAPGVCCCRARRSLPSPVLRRREPRRADPVPL